MCNAYNLKAKLWAVDQAAVRQLGLPLAFAPGVTAETSNLPVPEALFPKKDGLFLRPADPAAPTALEPVMGRWGLVPWNHRGSLKAVKFPCNNARAESMAAKWPFRDALARRRCVIPMTSFTEWTGPPGAKTKHAIADAEGGLLFAAGLWEESTPDEGPLTSYTMVMTSCAEGDDMAPFHDRQPVLLDARRAATWLNLTADFGPLLCALGPQALAIDPLLPAAA